MPIASCKILREFLSYAMPGGHVPVGEVFYPELNEGDVMTIRKKARIAWEHDLGVAVIDISDVRYIGYITRHNEYGFSLARKFGDSNFDDQQLIDYCDIADLHFADEVEEVALDCADRIYDVAWVAGKLFAAMETGQAVKIDYGQDMGVYTGCVEALRAETVSMKKGPTIIIEEIKSVKFVHDETKEPCEEEDEPSTEEVESEISLSIYKNNNAFLRDHIEKITAENIELKRSLSEPVLIEEPQRDVDADDWVFLIRVAKSKNMRVQVTTKHPALSSAKTDIGRFIEVECGAGDYSLLAREVQGDKDSIYHNTIVNIVFLGTSIPPPHDIAKERLRLEEDDGWGIRDSEGNHMLVSVLHPDSHKMALLEVMAAGPELADKMRMCLNAVVPGEEVPPAEVVDIINLLRKLGVPNVAPWYKGDE